MSTIKFTNITNNKNHTHWEYCEKNYYPFISTTNIGRETIEVFYDITNFDIDYTSIAKEIKAIFLSYAQFFLIPFFEYEAYLSQEHFFFDAN